MSTTKEHSCPECGCLISSDLLSADKMRRYFFATIRDIHNTLDDRWLERFPSSEHLRKHALIAAGWCNSTTVVAGSKTAALNVSDLIKSMDRYAIVTIRGDVLTVFTARSMSRRELLKPHFRELTEKVLHWIATETGIHTTQKKAA